MAEMQFHFLHHRVVTGGESERLDLIVWGFSSPGIVLIKRRCPALCFPPRIYIGTNESRFPKQGRQLFWRIMCGETWPKSPRGALCENKAIVGVKALGGHIKAVGVASSLHQEACKALLRRD